MYMWQANPDKQLAVSINGKTYLRYSVKTSFVKPNDSLENLIEQFVLPFILADDIIVLGEKIVALSQNRVMYKKDIKVGFWANFLAKFVKKTPAGFSVGNPLKMQLAINLAGLPRVILASIIGAFAKILGKRGWFYKAVGNTVSQIDGFYDKFFPQYAEIGILSAEKPEQVCQNLRQKYHFAFVIADINDLGGNVLGVSDSLKGKETMLKEILKDNPAGQGNQQTPIVIIRENV